MRLYADKREWIILGWDSYRYSPTVSMPGVLYIIATPIGNLEDITVRALRVLKEVDLIACEDTRHTRKLLAHYQIAKPTVSYHAHNERERSAELLDKITTGLSVALVSLLSFFV